MTAIAALCLGESPRHAALAAVLESRGYRLELTRAASLQALVPRLGSKLWDLILIEQPLDEAERAALLRSAAPVFSEAPEEAEALSERLLAGLKAGGDGAPAIDVKRIRKVTHDLSNALALITGFADLLAESAPPQPGGPAERYLSIIQRRSGEAVAFLEQIRALLKGEDQDASAEDKPAPQDDAPGRSAPRRSAPRASSGPLSLLLVDDEPRLLEVLSAHLRRAGHSVETAGDAREGLARFASGAFDLVLTDQEMPGLSGEDLARTIKQKAPGTPVILLTGHGEQQGSAADRTLGKPVRPTELLNVIRELGPAEGPL